MDKKYRIGIDLRDLKKARTGTYTYLNEIVKSFSKMQNTDTEIILLNYPFNVYTGKNYLLKIAEHLLFFIWKQLALPLLCIHYKCNVLFCTDYFLPLIKFKTKYYSVFHDCFFFDHPQYYNPIWLASFKTIGIGAAKKADGIIVPSVYVKNRLSAIKPSLQNKITVVYEGHADFSSLNEQPLSATEWNLISGFINNRKYILYVGTLDKRKNLERLIQAFQKVLNTNHQACLVIAGSSPAYKGSDQSKQLKKILQEKQLQHSILLTGRVQQLTLKKLYENASLLVQPSTDEGFGLPIVEAMHFELPFAAANNTAMPEIGGNAGMYFDPYNIDAMANAITALLENNTLKKELIQNANGIKERYNWDLAARQIMDIFMSK